MKLGMGGCSGKVYPCRYLFDEGGEGGGKGRGGERQEEGEELAQFQDLWNRLGMRPNQRQSHDSMTFTSWDFRVLLGLTLPSPTFIWSLHPANSTC